MVRLNSLQIKYTMMTSRHHKCKEKGDTNDTALDDDTNDGSLDDSLGVKDAIEFRSDGSEASNGVVGTEHGSS